MNYRTSASMQATADRTRAPELRVLFPAVAQLRVELAFCLDAHRPPTFQTFTLHPPASAYFRYPCPVSGCTGEFKLDIPAMRLMRESRTGMVDETTCLGVRPKDRVTGKPCGTRLTFKIDASYSAPKQHA